LLHVITFAAIVFLMQTAALGNKKYSIRGHKEMGLEEFYHE
jgi:hypothetical protein